MGIGYLLLYAALAVVAVWLTAELLLQHRAPLHWRALALVGFLCVVAGMGIGSVPVIGAGAAAFAAGQVFVTLAVKKGRTGSWSLRRPDGSLPGPLAKVPLLAAATGGAAVVVAAAVEPVGEVGPVEPEEAPVDFDQMQELAPEDGVYTDDPAPSYSSYYQPQPPPEQQQYYQPGYEPVAAQYQYPDPYADQQWQQQPQQQPVYGYDQSYAAQPQYQDPYAQQQQAQQQPQYQDPYGQPQQHHDPYGQPVPQQQPAYGYQSWGYQQQ
ncbi:hypothetical protein [Kitasatospora sp. MAP5-34]|uniref:hypothetical protein n=1 Tax=Kitasatospora sp. MAP5-34 TaxID=3035102 RepID=UPI0024747BCA|nr:hypothetical protein [Kitasatospora sp. MAP5-34]MDH6579986.1 hypothetical protein [Kitasatospora sp. MAP5-34]